MGSGSVPCRRQIGKRGIPRPAQSCLMQGGFVESQVAFGTLNTLILLTYLGAMVGIGALFAGRQKTTRDFFLAGQGMPWPLVAISIFASITSAITYMGMPGLVYEENISLLFGILMMPVAAPFISVMFLPVYKKYEVTTSYEYIHRRFGSPARYTASALFLMARLGWLGTVIYAPALALSVVSGIDLTMTILFMGVMGTLYTVLGGLAAVIWTDVVQFLVLFVGAVWVAVSLTQDVPGGAAAIFEVAAASGHLDIIRIVPSLTEMTLFVVMISYFIQFLHDYGVDQVTVQRLMATPTLSGMIRATFVNAFVSVAVVAILAFIGLGLYAYATIGNHPFPEGLARDRIFPYYIVHALPEGVSGLVITGIFAAAMSSVDSGINSLSTIVVKDFIQPLRNRPRTEEADVHTARLLTLAFGGFAVGIAFFASYIGDIIKTSQGFLGLFAGPILALFLLGILTKRGNFEGWLVGAVLALGTVMTLQYHTNVHFVYYFPIGTGVSFAVGWIMSQWIGSNPESMDLQS